jgi:homogentisate 1,2-dioxygenase
MPSTADLSDPKEYQKIFHWAETQQDGAIPSFNTRKNDPYEVCVDKDPLSLKFTTIS